MSRKTVSALMMYLPDPFRYRLISYSSYQTRYA